MPFASSDGVKLFYEVTGQGPTIVFLHEFAGDYRNWTSQVRSLSQRFRCITFNARGYPPSDVPDDIESYSHIHAVEDIASVLRAAGVSNAHIVGLSMGGYAALCFAIAHPEMTRSIVAAAVGHGSDAPEQFRGASEALSTRILTEGLDVGAADYLNGPIRRKLKEKDPRGFDEFIRQFAEHSAIGTALTARGCQMRRPTLYELEAPLRELKAPALIVAGDDDEPCLAPSLFLKRTIPNARLWVLPNTSHAINLEEPGAFNCAVLDFINDVERQEG
ncbi:alpha/beta fold hydrolase [Burkholderia multivorans]|uniref:alpha/beta fold hydrolase n=1 Tax=Burkholderia multivorans TaxID=87883 RepID=UPI001C236E37|nr:alpha/beta hydrolase [Burkholderia multivorans]MBU9606174.1 alpha/beta hydrolase [Burkholderia multivorans]MBU9625840.1 alpha/beta hydrolase [Burkholderia multivorans]